MCPTCVRMLFEDLGVGRCGPDNPLLPLNDTTLTTPVRRPLLLFRTLNILIVSHLEKNNNLRYRRTLDYPLEEYTSNSSVALPWCFQTDSSSTQTSHVLVSLPIAIVGPLWSTCPTARSVCPALFAALSDRIAIDFSSSVLDNFQPTQVHSHTVYALTVIVCCVARDACYGAGTRT